MTTKIFEHLKLFEEWQELGKSMKEIYAEMPRDDIENMTQEDMDKLICEEVWDQAIALVSRLVYDKLQFDLDEHYKSGPVADLKRAMTSYQMQ